MGDVRWEPDPNPREIERSRLLHEEGEAALCREIKRCRQFQAEQKDTEEATRSLTKMRRLSPTQFEDAVASLFAAMGWQVYWTQQSADHGIDLVLQKKNKMAAVQCKRYKQNVGEPALRGFYGAYVQQFREGYFVTTSGFSVAAMKWATRLSTLQLVDGQKLARWMKKHKPMSIPERNLWSG